MRFERLRFGFRVEFGFHLAPPRFAVLAVAAVHVVRHFRAGTITEQVVLDRISRRGRVNDSLANCSPVFGSTMRRPSSAVATIVGKSPTRSITGSPRHHRQR